MRPRRVYFRLFKTGFFADFLGPLDFTTAAGAIARCARTNDLLTDQSAGQEAALRQTDPRTVSTKVGRGSLLPLKQADARTPPLPEPHSPDVRRRSTVDVPGVWLLGLMTVRAQIGLAFDPRHWSVATARNVVRHAIRSTRRSRRRRLDFDDALAAATLDHYQRHVPKTSRNYPRKKRETPPRPPNIQPATAREKTQWKQLWSKLNTLP